MSPRKRERNRDRLLDKPVFMDMDEKDAMKSASPTEPSTSCLWCSYGVYGYETKGGDFYHEALGDPYGPDPVRCEDPAGGGFGAEYLGWLIWLGPGPDDLADDGVTLQRPVPVERWPYGMPHKHQLGCNLKSGGLFCDCAASDQSDTEWGEPF